MELLATKISDFFKSFDTFSESHSFKVKSKKGYSSSWGGFASIIFFLYAFYYFTRTLNLFLSGNFTNFEVKKENFPNENLITNEFPNFQIGFCLRNSDFYTSDKFLNKNLNFSLNFDTRIISNKTLIKTQKKISLENCQVKKSENLSEKFYLKQLENLDIENCKCIDFSKLNFTLKNFEENFEKNYFSLNLKIKENSEINKTEVLDYIKETNPQLSLFFPDVKYIDNEIDKNLNSTFEIKLKTKDFYLDQTATKILNLNFGKFFLEDFNKFYKNNGKE